MLSDFVKKSIRALIGWMTWTRTWRGKSFPWRKWVANFSKFPRYKRQKKDDELKRCTSDLAECDSQLREINDQLEAAREVISGIEKEIHESGASLSNLRDNIIARRLTKDIAKTQAEIDSHDMEEAGKARRTYDEKYEPAKKREKLLHEAVCFIILPFHSIYLHMCF